MTLIDKYITKNCLTSFVTVFLVLLAILMSNTTMRLLGMVNDGSLPLPYLIQLILLKTSQYTNTIIPISLFLGIIFGLKKLYETNEMVIFNGFGYSNKRLATTLNKIIIPIGMLSIIFNLFLTPYFNESRDLLEHKIQNEEKIYSIIENNFSASKNKEKVFYINNKDKEEKGNIFIEINQNDNVRIDIASRFNKKANHEDEIILNNGVTYSFDNDGSYSLTEYKTQEFKLYENIPLFKNKNVSSQPSRKLISDYDLESLSEITKRLSYIIATLILGYMAIPLSKKNIRGSNTKNTILSIFIYFSYLIFINLFISLSENILMLMLYFITLHALYFSIMIFYFVKSDRIH